MDFTFFLERWAGLEAVRGEVFGALAEAGQEVVLADLAEGLLEAAAHRVVGENRKSSTAAKTF